MLSAEAAGRRGQKETRTDGRTDREDDGMGRGVSSCRFTGTESIAASDWAGKGMKLLHRERQRSRTLSAQATLQNHSYYQIILLQKDVMWEH